MLKEGEKTKQNKKTKQKKQYAGTVKGHNIFRL